MTGTFATAYRIDPKYAAPLRAIGVSGDDSVTVDDERFVATFGWLRVDTPRSNIVHASVTGPYRWYRAIGARLSFADKGLTFGTTTDGGVCIEFHEPVAGMPVPFRHPGLTVTVDDREGLVAALMG